MYDQHPSKFVVGRSNEIQRIPKGHDRYTGRSRQRMNERRASFSPDPDARQAILRWVLREGAAWEDPSHIALNKVSKKFVKKRVGAKAAKAAEKFHSKGSTLNSSESTTYRALAARANYLALDRPDCASTTKVLCRNFSAPTHDSVED